MVVEFIDIRRSTKPHKFVIRIRINGKMKTIRFGRQGYEDYTIHKDEKRRQNYLKRHRPRENWSFSGVSTPGFWSRWVLWGDTPDLVENIYQTLLRLRVKDI